MPELPDVAALLQHAEALPRGLVTAAGALVGLAGARLYKLAIVAPGFALGVGVGLWPTEALDPTVRVIVALVLGVIGAALFNFVERTAIWGAGVIIGGGLTHAVWPLVVAAEAPWWGTAVGAVAGLLLFPLVFRAALVPATAALGAFIIAWAWQVPDNLVFIGGLAVVGLIVQMSTGRKKKDD